MLPRQLINLLEHDIGLMANWIERAGYGANLKQLQSLADELHITMTPLAHWLKQKALRKPPSSKNTVSLNLPRKFEPSVT